MAQENDLKGHQSQDENDIILKNGTNDTKYHSKGHRQTNGNSATAHVHHIAQNSKGEAEEYPSTAHTSDSEEERTSRYHNKITRALTSPNKSSRSNKTTDLKEPKYRIARFKMNRRRENIIHQIIQSLQTEDQNKSENQKESAPQPIRVAPPESLDYVEKTVLERPQLFTAPDRNRNVPLLEAAKHQPVFLFLVLNLMIPDTVRKRIKPNVECAEGTRCPLWEVAPVRSVRCQRETMAKTTSGDLNTHRRQSDGENANVSDFNHLIMGSNTKTTCLHDKIDVDKLLKEDKKLREILENALRSEDNAQNCLQSLLLATKFDSKQHRHHLLNVRSFKTILKLCPLSVFNEALPNGFNLLQLAVRLLGGNDMDFKRIFEVIELLVDHCPESIFYRAKVPEPASNKEGFTTAYRLLTEMKTSKENEDFIRKSELLLKKRCIGYRKRKEKNGQKADNVTGAADGKDEYDDMWAEKREVLYWDLQEEKQFCLNFAGESVILEKGYIDTIKERASMTFETVLYYVNLPYWRPIGAKLCWSKEKTAQQSSDNGFPDSNGEKAFDTKGDAPSGTTTGETFVTAAEHPSRIKPNPYIHIFDWLWETGKVQKIFVVEVDDDGPEPHTNAAIRRCLRGEEEQGKRTRDFEVEIWKWKKFEICSETIFKAAPAAREVHLYSHGNTAVLRGWACQSGLARLTELEKLVVEIHPQNESDHDDCIRYEEEFKQELESRCKKLRFENITVINHGFGTRSDGQGNNTAAARGGTGGNQDTSNPKILKSKEWIAELRAFKDFLTTLNLPQGSKRPTVKVGIVDDGAKVVDLKGIRKGASFRADKVNYCVGPCEHGTEMALCVQEIWPLAELYIARYDDSRKAEDQEFTISSCIEAIEWARAMDVDIISMSWTYESKEQLPDNHKLRFETLIKEIVQKGKPILFGSLPDMGPNIPLHPFMPVGIDGVIKICSATPLGQVMQENVHTLSDFLLPGEPGETTKGSSFATAYAAGLAALALYSLRGYDLIRNEEDDRDATKALSFGQTACGMRAIFTYLASGANQVIQGQKIPFVRPSYGLAGIDFAKDVLGQKRDLRRVVNIMLPDSELAKHTHRDPALEVE